MQIIGRIFNSEVYYRFKMLWQNTWRPSNNFKCRNTEFQRRYTFYQHLSCTGHRHFSYKVNSRLHLVEYINTTIKTTQKTQVPLQNGTHRPRVEPELTAWNESSGLLIIILEWWEQTFIIKRFLKFLICFYIYRWQHWDQTRSRAVTFTTALQSAWKKKRTWDE